MKEEALKEFLYKMADDQLIIGHRNSEWTGLGPLLEEDIAFSSMAQDKLGQSYTLYSMLSDLGESDPDNIAFMRNSEQFHNCQFVELPIGEYDFSLIRHFLFDTAELLRFELLGNSSFTPLAQAAKKFSGEIRYHTMHANSFMKQLGDGNEESNLRLQKSLDYAMPYALGIFENAEHEEILINEHLWVGEEELQSLWIEKVSDIIEKASLTMPDISSLQPVLGGRKGQHTEYLQPLLEEMTEVVKLDPTAEW
jgi:ring-1,2-phenylacetyl-CoA epoxidase subunit PaaC